MWLCGGNCGNVAAEVIVRTLCLDSFYFECAAVKRSVGRCTWTSIQSCGIRNADQLLSALRLLSRLVVSLWRNLFRSIQASAFRPQWMPLCKVSAARLELSPSFSLINLEEFINSFTVEWKNRGASYSLFYSFPILVTVCVSRTRLTFCVFSVAFTCQPWKTVSRYNQRKLKSIFSLSVHPEHLRRYPLYLRTSFLLVQ